MKLYTAVIGFLPWLANDLIGTQGYMILSRAGGGRNESTETRCFICPQGGAQRWFKGPITDLLIKTLHCNIPFILVHHSTITFQYSTILKHFYKRIFKNLILKLTSHHHIIINHIKTDQNAKWNTFSLILTQTHNIYHQTSQPNK